MKCTTSAATAASTEPSGRATSIASPISNRATGPSPRVRANSNCASEGSMPRMLLGAQRSTMRLVKAPLPQPISIQSSPVAGAIQSRKMLPTLRLHVPIITS
jgi:hypothetical protein